MHAVAARIVDQVGDGTAQGVGAQRQGQFAGRGQCQVGAGAAGGGGHIVEDRHQVGRLRLLRALAAREGEVAADHAVHFLQVGGHVGHFGGYLRILARHHGQGEAQAGERGAQIM